MDYIPLSDNAARQIIDSTTVFNEFVRVKAQAAPYAGGMYWKRDGAYEYLVKTLPDNRQRRIGGAQRASRATLASSGRSLAKACQIKRASSTAPASCSWAAYRTRLEKEAS